MTSKGFVSWALDGHTYDEHTPLYVDSEDATRFLTAADVIVEVRKLVSGLRKHGLKKGDRVLVCTAQNIHYTSRFLAVIGAGGVFTGMNVMSTTSELEKAINKLNPKHVIVDDESCSAALDAAKRCHMPQANIFVFSSKTEAVGSPIQAGAVLLQCGQEDWDQVAEPAEEVAAYFFTSGTSGNPKAAALTHAHLIDQGVTVCSLPTSNADVRQLLVTPPFHAYTAPLQHALPLRSGIVTFIDRKFSPTKFIAAIATHSITHVCAVPTVLALIAKKATVEIFSSIRVVYSGGSVPDNALLETLHRKLAAEAQIIQSYGMTEAGWMFAWQKSERDYSGSIGSPGPGVEARLVDDGGDGKVVVGEGLRGEIQVKTAHPFKHYLGAAKETQDAFSKDGWLRTGDLGAVKNGNWYVVARIKELIKVKGYQVAPAEVENVILQLAGVEDVGVAGVSAGNCVEGEWIYAFVKRQKGFESLTGQDVIDFVKKEVSPYKQLKKVVFVDRIPRNSKNSILRNELTGMLDL